MYTVTILSCRDYLQRAGFNIDPDWVPPVHRSGRITLAEIKQVTAERFGLTVAELESDRRDRRVARPRQVAMYLARHLALRSLPEIGRSLGNRDHTTVRTGCLQIERLCAKDSDLSAHIDALTAYFSTPRRSITPVLFTVAQEANPATVAAVCRQWCDQCSRNVLAAEADRCASPFCKAKPRLRQEAGQ